MHSLCIISFFRVFTGISKFTCASLQYLENYHRDLIDKLSFLAGCTARAGSLARNE